MLTSARLIISGGSSFWLYTAHAPFFLIVCTRTSYIFFTRYYFTLSWWRKYKSGTKHTSSDLESLFLFLPDFRIKEKNHAHIHTYGLQITKSSIFI